MPKYITRLIQGGSWKYAVGELVLIVSGVSLALAANAWYGAISDERTEAEYLIRLRASLDTDVARFTGIETAMRSKAATLQAIQSRDLGRLLAGESSLVMQQLEYSNWGYLAESDRVTFDELVTTGNLSLIDDYEFRDDLARYYNGYEFARELGEMTRTGTYSEAFAACLPGEVNFSWLVDREASDIGEISKSIECIVSHSDSNRMLNAEISYAATVLSLTMQFRIRAEQLIRRIDAID